MKFTDRYLGVKFGSRLNVIPLVNYITAKTRNMFGRLVNLAKAHWGLNTKIIRTIYKGLVLPLRSRRLGGQAKLTPNKKTPKRTATSAAGNNHGVPNQRRPGCTGSPDTYIPITKRENFTSSIT